MKLNTTAIIIATAGLILLTIWLLPNANEKEIEISKRYNLIAQQYDDKTNNYKDINLVIKLQNEITAIDKESRIIKVFEVIIMSLIYIPLTALLATLLQYLFTDLPFTRYKFKGEDMKLSEKERTSSMVVLASALLTSGILVTVLHITIFLR
ncbi:MAG: hypothetical protein QXD05_00190 [Candidatus Pacearchaeota archaeon]